MGALRAAECHPFGMVGVGDVFRAYREGELTDDDEVALAHADADSDFRPLSVPMVNVRATIRAAVDAEVIDTDAAQQLIAATKARYFPERTWPDLLEDAASLLDADGAGASAGSAGSGASAADDGGVPPAGAPAAAAGAAQ